MPAETANATPAADVVYRDSPIDRLFILLFTRKMARVSHTQTQIKGYDGIVDLSHQIMQGRSVTQQQQAVTSILESLVPAPALAFIRAAFSPTKLVCELNAWFASHMFEWLVGPCRVDHAEVSTADGVVAQNSTVHIEKCRYLERSGCVGMCVNMCKLPTQAFFTEQFGIPLTMTPDFETLSCNMVFGQPPSLEPESAYTHPCFDDCPTASASAACHQVQRSDRTAAESPKTKD
ncbi:MAG: DUF4033 domain-containing protein [Elainellaceae cyanobacterium]